MVLKRVLQWIGGFLDYSQMRCLIHESELSFGAKINAPNSDAWYGLNFSLEMQPVIDIWN